MQSYSKFCALFHRRMKDTFFFGSHSDPLPQSSVSGDLNSQKQGLLCGIQIQYQEAQDYFNDLKDRMRIDLAEVAKAIIIESGDGDEGDDDRKPIKSPIGTKFIDQLGRFSLSLYTYFPLSKVWSRY